MSLVFPMYVAGAQGASGSTTVIPGGSSGRGSHQLACVAECPRKWMLRYIRRMVPAGEPSFRLIGTLVHLELSYWYAERMKETPKWFYATPVDEALAVAGSGQPDQIELCRQVCAQYTETYSNEPWEPLFVEKEFRARVGDLDPDGPDATLDDEIVTGRMDLVVKTRVGTQEYVYIVDHKCTGGGWNKDKLPRWTDENEYRVPWQSMIYLHLLRHHLKGTGQHVEGFIINRVKRTRNQYGKFDFDRHVLKIPTEPYNRVPRTVRELVAEERAVKRGLERGEMPRANFFNCFGRWGPCDYTHLCCASDENQRAALLGLPVPVLQGLTPEEQEVQRLFYPPQTYTTRK